MKACRNTNCKLISVMSTCIYPDAPYVTYPITEDQLHLGPPHSSNFGYAYAKRMLDVQARAYRRQWGCNFVNVIPNNLYGLNDNYGLESGHVIPSLIRKFYEAKLEKKPSVILWGTGNPLREFTFARDAAKIIHWITKNYDGEDPVNIGCTKEISIKNLSSIIGELVGFDGEIIWDTSKPDGQFRKSTSNRKLRELGWKEEYTSLENGLRETIQYFKDNYPNLRGIR
jgi:GDP-L-fucose synthase